MRNCVGKRCAFCRFDSGNADSVRADSVGFVKVVSVFEKCKSLETVVSKSEKCADTDIVESCAESSVHNEKSPAVVSLEAARMELGIEFFVVGFLETDVCSDLLFLQKPEVVFALRRDLDINPADGVAVPVCLVNFSDRVSVVFYILCIL